MAAQQVMNTPNRPTNNDAPPRIVRHIRTRSRINIITAKSLLMLLNIEERLSKKRKFPYEMFKQSKKARL